MWYLLIGLIITGILIGIFTLLIFNPFTINLIKEIMRGKR